MQRNKLNDLMNNSLIFDVFFSCKEEKLVGVVIY